MQIAIDAGEYEEWKANNQDGYGAAVFRYAERWAEMMEERIEDDVPVADAADATKYAADDEGITGMMFGMAVGVLAKTWVYGEELRRWHNGETQIAGEGDKANEDGGVLNPAVLRVNS